MQKRLPGWLTISFSFIFYLKKPTVNEIQTKKQNYDNFTFLMVINEKTILYVIFVLICINFIFYSNLYFFENQKNFQENNDK